MYSKFEKAIISTLAYGEIFSFPLTKEEIWRWLIKFRIQNSEFRIAFEKLNLKDIEKKDRLYFLQGRREIVKLRKEREKWSKEKTKTAIRICNLIKLIPSVKFIGISGGLAVNNAKKDDDIDLFIITSKNSLWTTRLLAILLLEILGKRRRPTDCTFNNKICLNMFLDELHFNFPKNEQDLYLAHEIAQMKPLCNKDQTYERFQKANQWIVKFLPNAISIKYKVSSIKYKNNPLIYGYIVTLLRFIEVLSKNLQLWYMQRHRTTEKIGDGAIRFHPHDVRDLILKRYQAKLKKYLPKKTP